MRTLIQGKRKHDGESDDFVVGTTCRRALNDARGCAVMAGYVPNHHGESPTRVQETRALRELKCISETTAGVRWLCEWAMSITTARATVQLGPGAW